MIATVIVYHVEPQLLRGWEVSTNGTLHTVPIKIQQVLSVNSPPLLHWH